MSLRNINWCSPSQEVELIRAPTICCINIVVVIFTFSTSGCWTKKLKIKLLRKVRISRLPCHLIPFREKYLLWVWDSTKSAKWNLLLSLYPLHRLGPFKCYRFTSLKICSFMAKVLWECLLPCLRQSDSRFIATRIRIISRRLESST